MESHSKITFFRFWPSKTLILVESAIIVGGGATLGTGVQWKVMVTVLSIDSPKYCPVYHSKLLNTVQYITVNY